MGSDVEKPALLDAIAQSKQEPKKKTSKRDCFCRLLNICTAICALLCLVRNQHYSFLTAARLEGYTTIGHLKAHACSHIIIVELM